MRAPEQKVEDKLLHEVHRLGGMVEKIAPIRRGIPDRMVILGGKIHLVELKAGRGKLRPDQVVFRDRCWTRGVEVVVLHSELEVTEWLKNL